MLGTRRIFTQQLVIVHSFYAYNHLFCVSSMALSTGKLAFQISETNCKIVLILRRSSKGQ